MDSGLTSISSKKNKDESPFAGFVFLFTGSLDAMSRDEAKVRVKENGGKVASQINQKVTHVIVGKKPGSKLKKAQGLGLEILTEKDFAKLLESNNDQKKNPQLSMF
jgi:DNA ligase (NAD+)